MCVLVAQLYLTLCNSMDCSLPGSSVHGIFPARILGWVAIPFSSKLYNHSTIISPVLLLLTAVLMLCLDILKMALHTACLPYLLSLTHFF